MTETEAVS